MNPTQRVDLEQSGPYEGTFYIWEIHNAEIHTDIESNKSNPLSEWLLFNANSAIFQLYHDENKLIINEMITRSALF
jgi:hypothetical protein